MEAFNIDENIKSGDSIYEYMVDDTINKKNWSIMNKPFINNLYFNMKNNAYEVTVMWCLLIITIILLLSLLVKDANDEIETQRII